MEPGEEGEARLEGGAGVTVMPALCRHPPCRKLNGRDVRGTGDAGINPAGRKMERDECWA
jgi:hypothetical protein